MSRFMQDVNLGDVPELQTLPDGVIIVEFESWEEKLSSNGNKMAKFCTKIIAPEEVALKAGKYYMHIPIMNETMFRWKNMYEAAGILDKATAGFDPDDLLTLQVGIIIGLREYQGSPRNEEKKFLPVGKTKAQLVGKWEDVEAMEIGGASQGSEGDTKDNPFG